MLKVSGELKDVNRCQRVCLTEMPGENDRFQAALPVDSVPLRFP